MSVLLTWIGLSAEPDARDTARVIRDFMRNLERLADSREVGR